MEAPSTPNTKSMVQFQSAFLRPIVGFTPNAVTTLCRSYMYRLRIALISIAGAIVIIGAFHVVNNQLQPRDFQYLGPQSELKAWVSMPTELSQGLFLNGAPLRK